MTQAERDEIRALVLSFSTKISDLPEVEALQDGDYVVVVQDDGSKKHSKKATLESLLELIKVYYPDHNGAKYQGIAHPSDNTVHLPVGTDGFWFAIDAGIYTNYGGIVVGNSPKVILYNVETHEWTSDDLWGDINGAIAFRLKPGTEANSADTFRIPVIPNRDYMIRVNSVPSGSLGSVVVSEYSYEGTLLKRTELEHNPNGYIPGTGSDYIKVTLGYSVGNPISIPDTEVILSSSLRTLVEGMYNFIVDVLQGEYEARFDNIENNVSTIFSRLSIAEGAIDALESSVSTLGSDLDSLGLRVSTLESECSDLQATVGEIGTTVGGLASGITDIQGDIQELSGRLTDTEGNVHDLDITADRLSSRIYDAEGNISLLEQTSERIELAVQDVQGDVGSLQLTATDLTARMSNAEGDVGQLQLTAEALDVRMTDAEGDVGELQVTATDLTARMNNAEGDVSQLQLTAQGLEVDVRNAKGDINELEIRADGLTQQIRNAEGDIHTLESTATTLQSTIGAVDGRVSNLSQTVESIDATVQNQQGQIAGLSVTAEGIDLYAHSVAADLSDYEDFANAAIAGIQQQIDGAIDTWFYDYMPVHTDASGAPDSQVPLTTITVAGQQVPCKPYYDWYTADQGGTAEEVSTERLKHLGDIFYDNKSGYAFRFSNTGTSESPTFAWVEITDSAVIKALADAARAQDTADHKRRVFVSDPYAPYDEGDLWVKGRAVNSENTTELYRCRTARERTTDVYPYNPAVNIDTTSQNCDWIPADSYGYKVNKANLEVLSNAIVGQVTQITYNADGTVSSQSSSAIQQTAGQIRLQVANGAIDTAVTSGGKIAAPLLATGIDIVQGNITLIADHIALKNQSDQTGLELITLGEGANKRVVIDASSINVNGVFTTSAWSSQVTSLNSTAQGYADTAEANAKTYAEGEAADAEAAAKAYAESEAADAEAAAKTYAEGEADAAEAAAKAYAKDYADNVGSASVTSAETYFNNIVYGEGGTPSSPTSGSILYMIDDLGIDLSTLDDQINDTGGLADQIQAATQGLTDLGYLAEALYNGQTVVAGGLIVSSLVQLGSKTYNGQDTPIRNADGSDTPGTLDQSTWKVWSGINGVYVTSEATAYGHGIAAWYGGAMLDRYYSGNTDANRAAKTLFRMDGSGYVASNKLRWDSLGNLTVDGYVLTNEIQLKDSNNNITAGISGAYSSSALGHGIAAWYGGPKVDLAEHLTDNPIPAHAKTLFRMDGSGYLADRAIFWSDQGDLHLNTNIVLGDTTPGNPTINSILTFMAKFGSWFVEDTTTMTGKTLLRINMGSQSAEGFDGLIFDGFLVSGGDQIVGSGTPGGGGGGGASYLSDLLDVKYGLNPSADDLLIYSSSVPLNPDGTVTGPGWTTIAKSSVGRIYTGGTGITIGNDNTISVTANTYAPYNSAGYLPLSGGTISTNSNYPLTITNSGTGATSLICFYKGTTRCGWLGFNGQNSPVYVDGSTGNNAYALLHTGNTSISNSALTLGSTSLGTSTAPIGWASAVVINGLTTEANITQDALRVYSGSGSTWAGSVASMAYAAILAIGGPSRGWQMWARRAGGSGLSWRRGIADATAWEAERLIYDSGNLTKSVLTTLLEGNSGYYVKKSGDTMSSSSYIPLTLNSTSTVIGMALQLSGVTKMNVAFSSNTIGAYIQNVAVSGSPYVNLASDGQFKYSNNYVFLHSQNYSSYALPLAAGSSYPLTNTLYITLSATSTTPDIIAKAGSSVVSYLDIRTSDNKAANVGFISGSGWGVPDYGGAYLFTTSSNHAGGIFVNGDGVYYSNTSSDLDKYTVYHSGNSNKSDVAWSAATLTAVYAHLGNGNSVTSLELFGSSTGAAIGFYKSGTRGALLYSNGDAPFQRYNGDWTTGYTIYDSGSFLAGTHYVSISGDESITGKKTFSLQKWVVSGNESNQIEDKGWGNSTYYKTDDSAVLETNYSIRHSLRFRWYSEYYDIGAIRDGSTGTIGFGIGKENSGNTHVLDLFRVSTSGAWVIGNTVYHAGNSNSTSVPWSASSLTLNGALSGATTGSFSSTLQTTGRVQAAAYTFSGGLNAGCSTPGWYRVFTSSRTNASSSSILLHIVRTYNNASNEAYTISINISYNGKISFSQLSGDRNTGWIQKVRVDYVNSGVMYVDLYYAGSNNNGITVSGEGFGTFQSPTLVSAASGTTVEFSLGSGMLTNGSVVSAGDQVISSDLSLKTNLAPVTYSVEDIAKTRAVTFDWKDGRGHSAGSIAQDWKPLIPELVHGEEGNMTLAYGQIALVNSILEAKAICALEKHETEQDKEIKRLKARVRDLEKQLKMRS